MRVGVVDVGTNSVRLLVADVEDGMLQEIERGLVITRLGEGVDRARALAPEPIRRTVAAVADAVERSRAHGAERIRIVATSAVRDAGNREDFARAVRDATGESVEALDGAREVALGFRGATAALDAPAPYLVVDVGGGSTEIVRGTDDVEAWVSLDVGSVRMTERHVGHDPPLGDELERIAEDVDRELERASRALGAVGSTTFVGLAGTITTVTAIALGLGRYDRARIHHARLRRGEIGALRARLALMTSTERRDLPVMPPGREDVIVAGLVILERIMDGFGARECLVSESDLLDGAALEAS